jgi:hypothetical protein
MTKRKKNPTSTKRTRLTRREVAENLGVAALMTEIEGLFDLSEDPDVVETGSISDGPWKTTEERPAGAKSGSKQPTRLPSGPMHAQVICPVLVEVRKTQVVSGGLPAGDWATYNVGSADNPGVSLPVGYLLIGELAKPIRLGEGVEVKRQSRNGVECPGDFISTPVVELGQGFFRTQNSVYRIRQL